MSELADLFSSYSAARSLIDESRGARKQQRKNDRAKAEITEILARATLAVRARGPDADWIDEALRGTDEAMRSFALLALQPLRPFPRRFLIPVLELIEDSRDWSRARQRVLRPIVTAVAAWDDEGQLLADLVRLRRRMFPDHQTQIEVRHDKPNKRWRARFVAETEGELIVASFTTGEWDRWGYDQRSARVKTAFENSLQMVDCFECQEALVPSNEAGWYLCFGCGGAFDFEAVMRAVRALD